MANYTYRLYHTTTEETANAILANGFAPRAKPVQLSNSPWKIGTKGDTVVEVTIALEYDPNSELSEISFHPQTVECHHVLLTHDQLNNCRDTFRILSTDEKNALRSKYKTPGRPTPVDRDDDE